MTQYQEIRGEQRVDLAILGTPKMSLSLAQKLWPDSTAVVNRPGPSPGQLPIPMDQTLFSIDILWCRIFDLLGKYDGQKPLLLIYATRIC